MSKRRLVALIVMCFLYGLIGSQLDEHGLFFDKHWLSSLYGYCWAALTIFLTFNVDSNNE